MAPSAVETAPAAVDILAPGAATKLTLHTTAAATGDYKTMTPTRYNRAAEEKGADDDAFAAAKYPNYLPAWDPDEHYPPLEPFDHVEHGKDAAAAAAADPAFPDLFPRGVAHNVRHLTPTIGSDVRGGGVQLSALSPAGRDQLARFVAERKVVAFREQDFADLPIDDALAIGRYFGRLHIHPTSGAPPGHPEVHVVHRPAHDPTAGAFLATRTSSVAWHSDVSYELQPPGTTFLYLLEGPPTGGDTLFVDTAEAYRRLSPALQQRLHGLYATHSGLEQVAASVARGSIKRREPVFNVHPVVRTHPVTGEKALYVNDQFTREIVGFKKEESDALLAFLYRHLATGADFHARIQWEPGTVVVWDNRVTQHTAIVDWFGGERRHLARITPQAERPYQTPWEGKEEEEEEKKKKEEGKQ